MFSHIAHSTKEVRTHERTHARARAYVITHNITCTDIPVPQKGTINARLVTLSWMAKRAGVAAYVVTLVPKCAGVTKRATTKP